MSAEAPKGIVESSLLLLGNSRRRFTGALKRLFVVTPESGSTAPPIPTSSKPIQPPRGLEDFADRMQQIGDGRFAAQRQKEIDIASAKATQIAAEEAEKLKIAQIPIDLARQEASKRYEEERKRVAKEATDILGSFRIRERLDYIKDTLWEGKGEIITVGEGSDLMGKKPGGLYDYYRRTSLGGLALVYTYPSCKLIDDWQHEYGPTTIKFYYKQQYVPETNSTGIYITEASEEQPSGEVIKMLRVTSSATSFYPNSTKPISLNIMEEFIPRETQESETLLEDALAQESIRRVDRKELPSQLEAIARKKLADAKRGPNWQRWKIISTSESYRGDFG